MHCVECVSKNHFRIRTRSPAAATERRRRRRRCCRTRGRFAPSIFPSLLFLFCPPHVVRVVLHGLLRPPPPPPPPPAASFYPSIRFGDAVGTARSFGRKRSNEQNNLLPLFSTFFHWRVDFCFFFQFHFQFRSIILYFDDCYNVIVDSRDSTMYRFPSWDIESTATAALGEI